MNIIDFQKGFMGGLVINQMASFFRMKKGWQGRQNGVSGACLNIVLKESLTFHRHLWHLHPGLDCFLRCLQF